MRITLDWGQNPKPKAAPGTVIIKLRDFEETPLPDWEAWAEGKKGSEPISKHGEMGSDPFLKEEG
jgi:hypothetical protein